MENNKLVEFKINDGSKKVVLVSSIALIEPIKGSPYTHIVLNSVDARKVNISFLIAMPYSDVIKKLEID